MINQIKSCIACFGIKRRRSKQAGPKKARIGQKPDKKIREILVELQFGKKTSMESVSVTVSSFLSPNFALKICPLKLSPVFSLPSYSSFVSNASVAAASPRPKNSTPTGKRSSKPTKNLTLTTPTTPEATNSAVPPKKVLFFFLSSQILRMSPFLLKPCTLFL